MLHMDDNTGQQPTWRTDVSAQAMEQESAHAPTLPPVRWSASEFISHQKGVAWYLTYGVAAGIVTFIVAMVSGIISGLVVGAACVVVGIYAGRKPNVKQYEINEDGISVDGHSFPYELFKSFAVVEEGAVRSVWLKPLRRFTPTMVMYFGPDEESSIINTLENFLPGEAQALDAFERATRRIRF